MFKLVQSSKKWVANLEISFLTFALVNYENLIWGRRTKPGKTSASRNQGLSKGSHEGLFPKWSIDNNPVIWSFFNWIWLHCCPVIKIVAIRACRGSTIKSVKSEILPNPVAKSFKLNQDLKNYKINCMETSPTTPYGTTFFRSTNIFHPMPAGVF